MRCYSIDCQLPNLLEAPLWMHFEDAFVVPETLSFAKKRRFDENQVFPANGRSQAPPLRLGLTGMGANQPPPNPTNGRLIASVPNDLSSGSAGQ